jgi:hypothetical protein
MAVMNLSAFWDRLSGRVAAKQKITNETFAGLVKDLASGKQLDAEKVADLLDRLSKKPADLQTAVDAELKKAEWRKQAAVLPALRAESDDIVRKIAATDDAYRLAIEKAGTDHAAALVPINARQTEVERLIEIGMRAEGQLEGVTKRRGPTPESQELRARAKGLRGGADASVCNTRALSAANLVKQPWLTGFEGMAEQHRAQEDLIERRKLAETLAGEAVDEARKLELEADRLEREIIED